MEQFEPQDLLAIIRQDFKEDFSNFQKQKKKPSRLLSFISLALSLGTVVAGFILIFFQKALGNNYWVVYLCFLLGAVIFGIFYWINIITTKKEEQYMQDFFKTINMAKYYGIQLDNLTEGYLDEIEITKEFSCPRFNLPMYLDGAANSSVDFLSFTIEGQKFWYGFMSRSSALDNTSFIGECYLAATFSENIAESKIEMDFFGKHLLKSSKLEKIDLESTEFKNLVNITCDDQVEARRIFSPKVMENLLEFKNNDQRAKFNFLAVDKDGLLGVVKNHRVLTSNGHSFVELGIKNIKDTSIERIHNKIVKESLDLFDLLIFIQKLDFFPKEN